MPSELPKFGTPRRGAPVCVPRQSIFSSSVMSESRLSILFSIGRAGFLKGCADCCAVAGARASARRLNMLESRFINMDRVGPEEHTTLCKASIVDCHARARDAD